MTVADLLQAETNEWDLVKIRAILPHLEDKIKAIKPSLSGIPDKRAWLGTTTGDYTTKTGYQKAMEIRAQEEITAEPRQNLDWFKSVWKLQTSPKIKLFLWKVFQKGLPVGELLAARNITGHTLCKRCGTLESINHLFLHCPFARNVWNALPVSGNVDFSGSIDLEDVWVNLCGRNCLPPTGLAEGQLAPWVLWQLWLARNNLCFNNKSVTEGEVISKALIMAKEWHRGQLKQTKVIKKIPCRAPQSKGCDLLRTDAAWRASNQMAGLGWVLKQREGIFSGKMATDSVISALAAEGLALRKALYECKNKGVKRLVCESDSTQLINALNGGEVPLELYGIEADITALAVSFDVISFIWIPRNLNSEADNLAKLCLVEGEAVMAVT